MTRVQHGRPRHPLGEFTEARAQAQRDETTQRGRAVRTVAGQSLDIDDFTSLLSILGLDDTADRSAVLELVLAEYVRRVAATVGVPAEATGFELSDTATAYLGLTERLPDRPDQDLMLVWDERLGWYVGVETVPDAAPVVVAYLGGDEVVPEPAVVARFADEAVAGRRTSRIHPVFPWDDRAELANRLTRYVRTNGVRRANL